MEAGLRHHVVQLECCGPVSVYVQVIFKMIMKIQVISNNKMMMMIYDENHHRYRDQLIMWSLWKIVDLPGVQCLYIRVFIKRHKHLGFALTSEIQNKHISKQSDS